MMAFDYHQVIDTDRWGARGGSNRISSTNALPARHVETITRLHNLIERLGAHVKILIVSHIHGSVVNEQNLVTTVQYSQLPVDCNSNMLQSAFSFLGFRLAIFHWISTSAAEI